MNSLTKKIAEAIKTYRESNNLSQRSLAEKMGVPTSTISRIEIGETGITSTILGRFCDVSGQVISFNVRDEDLLEVFSVCNYIIYSLNKMLGDEYDLTNLKLQKLLYYCQMEYVGRTGLPLFENNFKAWEHGPVHTEVYHKYKEDKYGIDPDEVLPPIDLNKEKISAIDCVLQRFGKVSAWDLREFTHQELPWQNSHQYKTNNPITLESLKDYYPNYRNKYF